MIKRKQKNQPDLQYKWKFAMGTTSRVPKSKLHYLILDIDCRTKDKSLIGLFYNLVGSVDNFFLQSTENGLHIYTDKKIRFDQFEMNARSMGADPAWIRIGLKRGYWFLADKSLVVVPWPVERMTLHHDKTGKKKGDA
jgi:hypothetical protein